MEDPGHIIKKAREAKGWSQQELGRRVRISQPAVKKIESGQTTQSKYLPQIAAALDIDLGKLLPAALDSGAIIPQRELVLPGRDFPVHASAEGGRGTLIISTDPIDFIPRPSPLVHVRDSYGIMIVGTSMVPEFRPGDIALVNPHLPPASGEPHIFYAERDGEGRATIKELRRQTQESWLVSQHNPAPGTKRDFALARKEWQWAHRVVGTYKRR
jgi:transcriptional regulator with XRE-family HTH domain